jgi:YggT family protein
MSGIVGALYFIIDNILWLIVLVLIIQAIISWLFVFEVISPYRHRGAMRIYDMANRLTDPLLRPIRNVLPNLGGVDISPVILILLVQALRQYILPQILFGIL